MNRITRICLIVLLVASTFSAVPGLHAQTVPASVAPPSQKVDAPETNSDMEAMRHSPAVQNLARRFGMSTENMARLLEDLNSAILIIAILWFVFRFVPKIYRNRSGKLQKDLFDARSATTEANERLAVVEERLSKLGIEIDAIRRQTEQDSVNDEKRIHESLEAEKQRLLASVDQEIEAAGAAARRDLKKYAANLAVERAMSELRLSEDEDRMLIRSFGKDLNGGGSN